ncbi:hypothetical protein NL676_034639 [Syzygium grande]|nr:hypothetical protein NL676_034639 [Syzygium grande]
MPLPREQVLSKALTFEIEEVRSSGRLRLNGNDGELQGHLQFSLHSVSLTPRRRRRATSDALAYASAADDASDKRGPPLPTSDVRHLPRAVASHKRGPLPPTSEVRLLALASALAPTTPTPTPPLTSEVCLLSLTPTPPPTSSALASDADADDASGERGPPLPSEVRCLRRVSSVSTRRRRRRRRL